MEERGRERREREGTQAETGTVTQRTSEEQAGNTWALSLCKADSTPNGALRVVFILCQSKFDTSTFECIMRTDEMIAKLDSSRVQALPV